MKNEKYLIELIVTFIKLQTKVNNNKGFSEELYEIKEIYEMIRVDFF